VIELDVDVEFLPLGDDGGIEPGDGGELVPEIVGFGVFGDVLRRGRWTFADLFDQRFFHARFHGDVHGGEDEARPASVEDGTGGFRIHPEIEFALGRERKFGIVGLRIDAAAHDDEFFGEFGEVGIEGNGQGEVGHRAGGVDGDVVWIFIDHAHEKVCGVFGGGFCGGRAFWHGRDFVGAVDGVTLGIVPCALVDDFAVERFPLGDVLLAVHQREGGAGEDGNVGAADDLEEAQGVLDFFVAPGIAGKDGDAENVSVRRIDERKDGLHVGAAGAGGVLVDDDFALGLRGSHGR